MKTSYTDAMTERFIMAVNDIIISENKSGGKAVSVRAFALSIGTLQQNLNRIVNEGQGVSIAIVETTCRIYRVNPTFIILGEGEMYLTDKSQISKRSQIKKKLSEIEDLLKS